MPDFVYIGRLPRPQVSTAAHHHPDSWEVCCYRHGEGVATVGGRAIPFSPGTIIAIPPGCAHDERSPGGFTTDFMHLRDADAAFPGVVVVRDDDYGSYRRVADQLEREFTMREPGWQQVCQHLTSVLVRWLGRWAGGVDGDDVVGRIKHRCAERLHDPTFSVGDALDGLRCSGDHARRLFRRGAGVTPATYLARLRLHAAKQAMIAGASVGAAAERAGIADPYYFSRLFRRHEGASPTAWLARRQSQLPATHVFEDAGTT